MDYPVMQSKSAVEKADAMSRLRPVLLVTSTVIYLVVQVMTRPLSASSPKHAAIMWAINSVLFMLLLITRLQGGLFHGPEVRALMNDDVTRANHRSAIVGGFWVAMISAMVLFFTSAGRVYTARDAAYVIVTAALGFAMLEFCFLEFRAHRGS
jgi:hypothetical protein